MKLLFFDLETYLFEPGMVAPPLVCGTFALIEDPPWWNDGDGGIEQAGHHAEQEVRILLRDETLDLVDELLNEPDLTWIAQNAPYDFSVILAHRPEWRDRIFALYEEGRVYDTVIYDKIIAIAEGMHRKYGGKRPFSLASIVNRRIGLDISDEKTDPDSWRLRYAELDGVPVAEWPDAAVSYAEHDVVLLAQVMVSQRASLRQNFAHREGFVALRDEMRLQHLASWALRLASVRGVQVDAEHAAYLEKHFSEEYDRHMQSVIAAGIVRDDGTKDMEALRSRVQAAYEGPNGFGDVPKTDKGSVKTDRDTLVKSGDPVLQSLAEAGVYEKRISTFIPVLKQGIVNPGYNVLVDSGRTSSFRPNIQQVPRKGGIREAFRPRPGYCFVGCDYDTLEMRSLAQILWEWYGNADYVPSMVQTLREGKDLHLEFATELLGIPYEEAEKLYFEGSPKVKEARQFAKVGNFGFPGGLGAETFRDYAAGYGLVVDEAEAKRLYTLFRVKWPEMPWYFNDISSMVSGSGEVVQSIFRVRSDVTFTSASNTFFQGLAANGAKWALSLLTKACYTDLASPVYGCRPIFFVHDEIIMEAPIMDDMMPLCQEMERLMIKGMARFIDSVPITCEAVPMDRWSKDAKRVFDERDRLKVWTPNTQENT